jgi:molybdopterin/thiamine biosynthesis adenylyltransferase
MRFDTYPLDATGLDHHVRYDFGMSVRLRTNAELGDATLRELTNWRRDQYVACGFYDPQVVSAESWFESEMAAQRPGDINVLATDDEGEVLVAAVLRQPIGLEPNMSFIDPRRPNFPCEEMHGRTFVGFPQLSRVEATDVWEIGRLVREQQRRDPIMRRVALGLALVVARHVTDPAHDYRFRLIIGDLDPNVALGLLYAIDAPVIMGTPRTFDLPDGAALAPRYRDNATAPFLVDLRDSGYASRTRWSEIETVLATADEHLPAAMDVFRAKVAATAPRPSRLLGPPYPEDREAFYREFTTRNVPLIHAQEQALLRSSKIVIAGCGSTGGACGMPLLRSGAEHFVVYDPGTFELNNFNRQEATLDDIGRNKAVVLAERMHGVNHHAEIEIHAEGVVPGEIDEQVRDAAVVIDAVDVTTKSGMAAKLALHRACVIARVPVITAYDIAMRQYIEVFDYRTIGEPFDGRIDATELTEPNEMLAKLLPVKALPLEIFPVIRSRAKNADEPFPQLAMTANLLSAVIVPLLLNVLSNRHMPRQYCFDLLTMTRTRRQRVLAELRRLGGLPQLWRTLRDAKKTTPGRH